jgi:hypothetical protein
MSFQLAEGTKLYLAHDSDDSPYLAYKSSGEEIRVDDARLDFRTDDTSDLDVKVTSDGGIGFFDGGQQMGAVVSGVDKVPDSVIPDNAPASHYTPSKVNVAEDPEEDTEWDHLYGDSSSGGADDTAKGTPDSGGSGDSGSSVANGTQGVEGSADGARYAVKDLSDEENAELTSHIGDDNYSQYYSADDGGILSLNAATGEKKVYKTDGRPADDEMDHTNARDAAGNIIHGTAPINDSGGNSKNSPTGGVATDGSAAKDGGAWSPDEVKSKLSDTLGQDKDGDGWRDDKKPLEPGSVDVAHLESGRDVKSGLDKASKLESGASDGMKQLGADQYLPRVGDPRADDQIDQYEKNFLSSIDKSMINSADPGSFLRGGVLDNLTETEKSGADFLSTAEDLAQASDTAIPTSATSTVLHSARSSMRENAEHFREMGENISSQMQATARAGDVRNSVATSLTAATQDAFTQISEYAAKGGSKDPKFHFIEGDLRQAVDGTKTSLSAVQSKMDSLSSGMATLTGHGGDGDKGTPNQGGSTPAGNTGGSSGGSGGSGGGGGRSGGSSGVSGPTGGGSGRGDSGGSGDGDAKRRAAAEKLADLLGQGRGGQAAPQTGQPMPQMPQMPQMGQQFPQMPQMMQTPQPQMDPAVMGAVPGASDASGLTMTDDPYESILNPATHLTRDFDAGDMSQIRQGNATGADAATIRPYTAEARAADGMAVAPPAPAPGAATPRPGALGADMKPLDKDGDGKVDDDAVPATKENMTDEDGNPKEVETAVTIGDDLHKVTCDDPRLLEMMNAVGTADGDLPILDAAKEAGVDLESYGEMLDPPTDAKPGDVVISSKGNGFYLGDGEVLMESGEVKPLEDVLELRPPQSGIFRLDLPELPDEVDDTPAPDDPDNADAADAPAGDDAPAPTEGGDTPSADDAPADGEVEPQDDGTVPDGEVPPVEQDILPEPAIADEFADLDGDGIPDDNNGNGIPDDQEPVAGDPVDAPAAEEPADEAPVDAPADAPEPEDLPTESGDKSGDAASADQNAPAEAPAFSASGSLHAHVDESGVHASGDASATVRTGTFEGHALGGA